jgi:malonyl-CoA O-methyltransferase
MNTSFFKQKIEYSFDKYAHKYDSRTILQKEIMLTLLNFLYQEISETNNKKKSQLLDLGCGTGELSSILIKKLNFNKIHLLDLSSQMLNIAKKKINKKNVLFDRNDFDSFYQFDNYNIIVSNMALHWSANFLVFIERILNKMRKNTIFIFSIPDNKSFSFLKKVKLEELINEFPEKEIILKKINEEFECKVYEKTFFEETFSLLDFFKNMKKIGANVSNRSIDVRKLLKLRKYCFKEPIKINYNINFFIIKK